MKRILNSKWHFNEITWHTHKRWWKPYIHDFYIENELADGELRFKTEEELKRASKANISYWGHDAMWIFNWLGFRIEFFRY
jgi:hypothetical protein